MFLLDPVKTLRCQRYKAHPTIRWLGKQKHKKKWTHCGATGVSTAVYLIHVHVLSTSRARAGRGRGGGGMGGGRARGHEAPATASYPHAPAPPPAPPQAQTSAYISVRLGTAANRLNCTHDRSAYSLLLYNYPGTRQGLCADGVSLLMYPPAIS